MIFYLFSFIYCKNINDVTENEPNSISVKGFHDYTVNITNQPLNIIVSPKTYIFISSIAGFTASIYKSAFQSDTTKIGEINPDTHDRLIYFDEEGSIKVLSTIPALTFIFHSTQICNIIDNDNKNSLRLIVTSKPDEFIKVFDPVKYYRITDVDDYYYIGDYIFWLISDKPTYYNITGYGSYAVSDDNYSTDEITFIPITTKTIYGKSKMVTIKYLDYVFITPLLDKNKNKIDYYSNYKSVVDDVIYLPTCIIESGKYQVLSHTINNIKDDGIIPLDFYIAEKHLIKIEYKHIIILPSTIKVLNTDSDGIIHGALRFDTDLYYQFVIMPKRDSQKHIIHLNFEIIKINVSKFTKYEYIISKMPTEYLLIDSIDNKDANYSNEIYNYCYIQANLQDDISTKIEFSDNISIFLIKYKKLEPVTITSGSTIYGPFVSYINIGTKAKFTTKPKGEIIINDDNNIHQYCHYFNRDKFISSKYGLYNFYDSFYGNDRVLMSGLNMLKITRQDKRGGLIYIRNRYGWKGEIIYPELPLEDREFGPHLNRQLFYMNNSLDDLVLLIHYLYPCSDEYYYLDIIHFSTYNCEKHVIFNQVPSTYRIGPNKNSNAIEIELNETLCMHYLGTQWANFSWLDINNIKYSYDVSRNTDSDRTYDYFLYIQNNNSYSEIDIDFYPLEEKVVQETNDFYFEGTVNNSFQYAMNQYYQEDEPDYFDGEEYTINKWLGHKFVDMTHKKIITINCPAETLLYIHNIKGFQVDGYFDYFNESDTINDSVINKVFYFSEKGKVIIKKNHEFNSSKLLSESISNFYFSYIYIDNLPCNRYLNLFVCSNPNKTIVINNPINENTEVKSDFKYDNNYNSILWFSFPFDVELNMEKFLPNTHLINDNYTFVEINSDKFTIKGKDIFLLIKENKYDLPKLNTSINVKPVNKDDMEKMKYYDILNDSIIITGVSKILQIKPTPKPTEKNISDDDDGDGTLIMIIIIVSVVGGVAIIAIVVGCCIYRSKKKKSAISNEASTNEDENKP